MTQLIPFTFAGQSGNVPASELDNNFTAVQTSLTSEASIATGSTVDLGAQLSNNIIITGNSSSIASFGSSAVITQPLFFLRFSGTGNTIVASSAIQTTTGGNISVNAGDQFKCNYLGSGNWLICPLTANVQTIAQQIITTSLTYTPNPRLIFAYIEVGGGGAGGSAFNSGTAGGPGGTTSVGSLITAGGGNGGSNVNGGSGSSTGTGAGAAVYAGGSGSGGSSGAAGAGGVGGICPMPGSVPGAGSGNGGSFAATAGKFGGGGGGGGNASTAGGGGGGAGAYSAGYFSAAAIGASQVVTIGAGGTASSPAGTGGPGLVRITEYLA